MDILRTASSVFNRELRGPHLRGVLIEGFICIAYLVLAIQ